MLGAAFLRPPHGSESGAQHDHAAHDQSTQFYVAHTTVATGVGAGLSRRRGRMPGLHRR
jgi:hypothetical protein